MLTLFTVALACRHGALHTPNNVRAYATHPHIPLSWSRRRPRRRHRSGAVRARPRGSSRDVTRRVAPRGAQVKRAHAGRRSRKRPRDKPKTVPQGRLNSPFCHANRGNEGGRAGALARTDVALNSRSRSPYSRSAMGDSVVVTQTRLHDCSCS